MIEQQVRVKATLDDQALLSGIFIQVYMYGCNDSRAI